MEDGETQRNRDATSVSVHLKPARLKGQKIKREISDLQKNRISNKHNVSTMYGHIGRQVMLSSQHFEDNTGNNAVTLTAAYTKCAQLRRYSSFYPI